MEDFIQAKDQQDGYPARVAPSPQVSNVIVPPLKQPLTEGFSPFIPHRLIILVPTKNLDTHQLAGQTNNTLQQYKSNLFFLGVVEDSKEESTANAYLTGLMEHTRGLAAQVEQRIVFDKTWIRIVKQIWRTDDPVIDPAEQSIPVDGKGIPLGTLLSQAFKIPVLMYTGDCRELHQHPRNPLSGGSQTPCSLI